MIFRGMPAVKQFLPMLRSPLYDEPKRSARERAANDRERLNLNLCLVIAVLHVEMRWRMIIPIHTNEDSEEFADGGHSGVLASLPPTIG